MHPYVAQHLAQAHVDHLMRYRQTRVPSGGRQTIPIRQRLHLLLRRWPTEPMHAGSWPTQPRLW